MSTTPANSNIEAIRLSVHHSCSEFIQLIEGPLAALSPSQLYEVPNEDEWSIMQNLVHTVEFMPYWAGQIEKVVATPGAKFGRTMDDEGRLQAISQHSRDSLEQVKEALPRSYASLEEVLGKLKDSDLGLTGQHPRYGEMALEKVIEDFVTQHLIDHIAQMKLCLQVVR